MPLDRRSFLADLGLTSLLGSRRLLPPVELDANRGVSRSHASRIGVPEDARDAFLMTNHSGHGLMGRMGWEGSNRVEDEILRLGPEVMNELDLTGFHGPPKETGFAARHRTVKSFAHRFDLPYGVGVHYSIQSDRLHADWYSQRPAWDRWEHPDGSTVKHPAELAAEDLHRNRRRYGGGDEGPIIPSIFAEGTKDRLVRTGSQIFELEVNEFWIDSIVGGLTFGFDFSHWAQEAFRDHLAALSAERLAELGITNPESFDVTGYIANHGYMPDDGEDPLTDPAVREYLLFQHRTMNEFAASVFERVRAGLPEAVAEAGTTVFGLGSGLQYHGLNPASIYVTDAVDVISMETDPTVPPDRPHDISVKICRAAGRFEKPVRVWGRMNERFETTHGLDTERYYPTLMQFQMAQVYGHGGRRSIPLTGLPNIPYDQSVNSWVRPDGTIGESLHRFVDFVRAHRRFLTEVSDANAAVIVVSLPTLLWQRLPDWHVFSTKHSAAIGEAAKVLRQEHVPYDVIILDHPPLWEAADQIERLKEYDLLVLAGVECVSNRHVAGIQAAVDAGGKVIVTGNSPTRDERFEPRTDLRQRLSNASNAVVIDEKPDISGTGPSAARLRASIYDRDRQLKLGTEADVSVNVFEQTTPQRLIIHLLNFEYHSDTDSMRELNGFELTVRDVSFEPSVAKFYTVDGVYPLPFKSDSGSVSVMVPGLHVWGFLALGRGEDSLEPATARSEAEAAIDSASTALEAISGGGDPHVSLASAKLEQAEAAFEYGSHSVAIELARDAGKLLDSIEDRGPIHGIDLPGLVVAAIVGIGLAAHLIRTRVFPDEEQ